MELCGLCEWFLTGVSHTLTRAQVAVIAGDYLLARASVVLAQLHSNEVTEIMSTALESLVQVDLLTIHR